ncbi:c-type cytochrome [Nitrosomonas communis]|uniref:c-type cytochrome n=1 Tax=Nitrosomonas communis TaxID=44574 RepID=UPI0026F0EECC|nr:c-type cytochrome [Nitrosomonas communis]
MEPIKPLSSSCRKKIWVIGSRSNNGYKEQSCSSPTAASIYCKSGRETMGILSIVFVLIMAFVIPGSIPASWATQDTGISDDAAQKHREGQEIFRFDTFGDEQLWSGVLRMHEAIATVNPATALAVGLKVDVEALPQEVITALQAGQVDLTNPAVTLELLRLNAVVGVKGSFDEAGQLAKIGVTCALCHSSVDNSFAPSIGKRLDGWANTDLNVGAIVALSPVLDDATKKEFSNWGPGKYAPRHHFFDGANITPLNSPSQPIVIPPIYGLKGAGFETYTADGPISYWNSYVGVGQMGGHGNFSDPRIGITIEQTPDLVTSKLPALLDYQLSLQAPKAPKGSFDRAAAQRGKRLFRNEAGCATCHRPPHFTDVLRGPDRSVPFLHDPSEIGRESVYVARSATKKYRTTPLRGLLQHPPYFHDGSAPDLPAVVNHYDNHFRLNLTAAQKADLVEYLKSL